MSSLLENSAVREKLWAFSEKRPKPSPFFLMPKALGQSISLSEHFPEPMDRYWLELGSGWGEVALELAKQNPRDGFVLWEKKIDRLRVTERKRKEWGLTNLRYLSLDFHWFFGEVWKPKQFHKVLVNFPDPWPKKKHHKNRIMQPKYFSEIQKWVKPNGEILFATDHGPYARKVIQMFREIKELSFDEEFSWNRHDLPYSEFEREKIAEGKRIYYLKRKLTSDVDVVP